MVAPGADHGCFSIASDPWITHGGARGTEKSFENYRLDEQEFVATCF